MKTDDHSGFIFLPQIYSYRMCTLGMLAYYYTTFCLHLEKGELPLFFSFFDYLIHNVCKKETFSWFWYLPLLLLLQKWSEEKGSCFGVRVSRLFSLSKDFSCKVIKVKQRRITDHFFNLLYPLHVLQFICSWWHAAIWQKTNGCAEDMRHVL